MLVMGACSVLNYNGYFTQKILMQKHIKDKAVCMYLYLVYNFMDPSHVRIHIPYQDTLKQHHVVDIPPGHVPLHCSQFYALAATPCILYCH